MQNNVSQLYDRIKGSVAQVEGGQHTGKTLTLIRTDCLELFGLLELLLISERDSYYGYFFMNLTYDIVFDERMIACIRLNTFPPVFATNPLFLFKFSLKEIIYIICHEIDHILLNHPAEMLRLNPEKDTDVFYLINLAADAAVNERINHEIATTKRSFLAAPEGIVDAKLLKEIYQLKQLSNLENHLYYYDKIKGKAAADHQQPDRMLQAHQGETNKGEQTDDGSAQSEVSGDRGNQSNASEGSLVTAKTGGYLLDHDWQVGTDPEDADAVVREFINAAAGMMSDEARGLMPGDFLEQLTRINQPPKINWQSLLKRYMGTISAGKRKTRMRLNRRQPHRFDIAGSVDDKLLKLVVAIDTSASMSSKQLNEIFNEIFSIVAKRRHEVTVIECDTRVHRVYRVRSGDDVGQKASGRGGTSFTPVINYINEHRYFRDALLIYFTDGYGESSIPRPRTYRNLWVILGKTDNLSVKEPFGKVIAY